MEAVDNNILEAKNEEGLNLILSKLSGYYPEKVIRIIRKKLGGK